LKIVGFDGSNKLINCESTIVKINGETQDNKSRILWEEMMFKSEKIVSLFDVGGSSKISVSPIFYFFSWECCLKDT
jgi:hypothetical protein